MPDEIKQAEREGKLVLFIGAGISNLFDLPLWDDFAQQLLDRFRERGLCDHLKKEEFKKSSVKKMLSFMEQNVENFKMEAAKFLQEKENEYLRKWEPNNIYETIKKINCVYVTTNYDELLMPRLLSRRNKRQTPKPIQKICFREEISPDILKQPGSGRVIHLHGCKSDPDTMVITERDYHEHYESPNIKKFLECLFKEKIVLFLGYGLSEEEILKWVFNHKKDRKIYGMNLFLLSGFEADEQRIYEDNYKYYKDNFSIKLLRFIMDNRKHGAIVDTIKRWVDQMTIQPLPPYRGEISTYKDIPPPDEVALSLYRDIELMNKILKNE